VSLAARVAARHLNPGCHNSGRAIVLRVAARWQRKAGIVDIRNIEITADNVEEVIGSLLAGVDDIDGAEKTTGLDLRSMITLLKKLPHNDDLFHNGETILQHMQWVLADLDEVSKTKDAATRQLLKVVALLHDLGKAYTHEFHVVKEGDPPKNTFYEHATKSVAVAEALLAKQREQLGDLYQRILDLVRLHDVFLSLAHARKQHGGGSVGYLKDFLREAVVIDGHLDTLLTFAKADSARAKAESGSLASLQDVMADIEKAEAKKLEAIRAKERQRANWVTKQPEIRALLEAEAPEAVADLPDYAAMRETLGRGLKYKLIKQIERIIA
jgi:putative nucleotidyltransferase with HDIG domain